MFEQNVERATKAELWAAGEEVALTWSPDHSFVVPEERRRSHRAGGHRRRRSESPTIPPHLTMHKRGGTR